MKPLTVYKASAGSGKTFRLATEYIKLLIRNPLGFRSILAVTFTNKATEEMKMRILSQLYGIWKLLPDSESYISEVTTGLGIPRQAASRQAGAALSHLLHNYNCFHVETIDAFFQTVLRNLAREMDLTANLRIELNDWQVEEQAVDELIGSLNETSVILQWLINYIETNIDDNKSWNVIGQIKSFGRTIFKEHYKAASKDLDDRAAEPGFFSDYMAKLKSMRAETKKHMSSFADEFERITAEAGLTPASYAGKQRGICNYFNKLRSDDFSDANCMNATLAKCLESADNWAAKSSPDRAAITALADNALINLLRNAEDERPKQWRLYMSADVTLRHLDKLRLLNRIEATVRKLNSDANRFLLSDTQHLLHSLIKDTDSPFIFEKIGSRLEHVMIDEFQDTSRTQWQNFKVLLRECMSHATEDPNTVSNLIVGDVKQSIYRWRSGDWRLLNNIEEQFPDPETSLETRSLRVNRRSERNIVDFNNAFFTTAARLEYETEQETNGSGAGELMAAYEDVCQDVPVQKASYGLVNITLFDAEEYDETMLNSIIDTVDKLVEKGANLSDIAILIRYNKHIPAIAGHFMMHRPEYKIVSDEAFRLDASMAVNAIMQALRTLNNPDDVLSKASLALTYQRKVLHNDVFESQILNGKNTGRLLDSFLPKDFISRKEAILKMPLFDIIEEIYSLFGLKEFDDQSAYLCAFYDYVQSFITDNTGNLDAFISEWDENLCSKTIQSDDNDGIRLISIHKSKGLEFDNVIVPYCDWMLENTRGNTLWCMPAEEPFCKLPLVPVDYSKKLTETIYAEDYKNEHLQNSVDNLNLLYVAFTRAAKNLFVMGKKGGVRTRSALLNSCLPEISALLEGSSFAEGKEESDPTVFEYGSLYIGKKQEAALSDNVFLAKVTKKNVPFKTFKASAEFKQSNKSHDFIENNDVKDEQKTYIKMGNILHNLFSKIRTTADIDGVIRQLEFDGVLYDDDITAARMRDTLTKRLSDRRVADWFSPRWTLFNECSILFIDPNTSNMAERRPDRVITDGTEMKVIDFKFGRPRSEYHDQVRQYMNLLKSMGYTNVSGYLWFVYSNEIVEVNNN